MIGGEDLLPPWSSTPLVGQDSETCIPLESVVRWLCLGRARFRGAADGAYHP